MAVYNTGVTRSTAPQTGSDPLVPEPLVADIIQMLPNQCVTLKMAKQVQMTSTTSRIPVLSLLPFAYFVGGDSLPNTQTLKQTATMQWTNVKLVVEEIAAIVPIPDAYIADSQVPLWDEVKPRLVEAIGLVIDQACLFGVGKPSTWSPAIVPTALSIGNNTVTSGTGLDLPQDLAKLAENLTKEGITDLNGWVARPGFKWKLIATRSAQGIPIYEPDLQDGRGGNLYGYDFRECTNGAWDSTLCDIIGGDWSKAIVGLRSDMTFKMFDQGVISDNTGAVVWNSMQNDGQALRVTIRLAFATANPVTSLRPNAALRYPFGILRAPAGQMS